LSLTLQNSHPWDLSLKEAKKVQLELADKVICKNETGRINYVAGVDVGFNLKKKISRAAIAVLSYPMLHLVEYAQAERETVFPYISGFLSFREAPVIIDALNKLKKLPDIILCDGQGIAHPRRLGIASHLGILTGIPSIGVAKSRLIGDYAILAGEKGALVYLKHNNEIIGAVVRTRTNIKPLFISIGHKVDLDTSLDIVWGCITKYRLPETTRWAHKLASGNKSV
jgi:deoxyribonuclease V